jgi:hypothetical protein
MSRYLRLFFITILLGSPVLGLAQTRSIISNLANPAIGMSALFLGQEAPNLSQSGLNGIQFQEAELSVISTVDPYWTLAANLVFGANPADGIPDTVEAEEAYATCDSIPDIQWKVGQMRAQFGKHGLLHTHAFPFIQAPIIMGNSIGMEGFKDAGIQASWLSPLPWFCELTAGGYTPVANDGVVSIGGSDGQGNHPLDFNSPSHDNIPYLVHLKNLVDVDEDTTMELGASDLTGMGDDGLHHAVYGADLTFRNVPLRQSNQHGWILQGEYIKKVSYEDSIYNQETDGWYGSFQDRLAQEWWTGVRYEQCFNATPDTQVDPTENSLPGHVQRVSADIAWLASEFSEVRAEYSYARNDSGSVDNRAMLQFNYVIGFHPPHSY